jgi:hypothetical protein
VVHGCRTGCLRQFPVTKNVNSFPEKVILNSAFWCKKNSDVIYQSLAAAGNKCRNNSVAALHVSDSVFQPP